MITFISYIHAMEETPEIEHEYKVEITSSSSMHRVEKNCYLDTLTHSSRDKYATFNNSTVDHSFLTLGSIDQPKTNYITQLRSTRDEDTSFLPNPLKPYYATMVPSSLPDLIGGSPPPDPLKELIKKHTDFREYLNRYFIRGNIQSFLAVICKFDNIYFRSLFLPFNYYEELLSASLIRFNLQPYRQFLLESHFNLDGTITPIEAPHQGNDLENVMKSERINKTKQAIRYIYDLLKGKDIDEELCIQELQQYLQHLQKSDRISVFKRLSSGMNEVANAMLALEGQASGHSYNAILTGNIYINLDDGTPVTIKSLLAKSWWLITKQFKGKQQEMIKESLIKSLGQCIEDDGHCVCDVGKSQRITTVLQGYIEGIKIDDFTTFPDPKSFISAFFTPRQKEIENVMTKTSEEQRLYAIKLLDELKQQAQQVYKDNEKENKEVVRLMKDFIQYSLDFEGDI